MVFLQRLLAIEYDPNRTANIALIHYADGEKSIYPCSIGLKVGTYSYESVKMQILK